MTASSSDAIAINRHAHDLITETTQKVFENYELVKRLSKFLGIRKTIALLRENVYVQRGLLTSTDVACLYDDYYSSFVDSHATTMKHNGYSINYYTQFAFDYLNTPLNVGKKLLDFGCGSGELSLALASSGIDVLGIDFDERAIRKAITKKGKAQGITSVRFEAKDINSVDENFDFIVFSDVVEHLSKNELLLILRKAKDLLKDGGELVIHTPNGNVDPVIEHSLLRKFIVRSFWFLKDSFTRFTEEHLLDAFYTQVHINVMTSTELSEILALAGFNNNKLYFRNPDTSLFRKTIAEFGFSADLGVVTRKQTVNNLLSHAA